MRMRSLQDKWPMDNDGDDDVERDDKALISQQG